MKILLDESVDAPVAEKLRRDGHQVICVWELAPGLSDEEVLALARENEARLVTADKDFGELVFRMQKVQAGVILIRLAGLSPEKKADIVAGAIKTHGEKTKGAYMVITPALIRIRVSN